MVAVDDEGSVVDGPGGVLTCCCPRLFGAVNTPLKMYPIGGKEAPRSHFSEVCDGILPLPAEDYCIGWVFHAGFLFGLGFDTASEVALLGLNAMAASSSSTYGSVPAGAIMVLLTMGRSVCGAPSVRQWHGCFQGISRYDEIQAHI